MRTSRNQGGFTLIEMIVVLAVVGTLAALITPRIFPYIDEAKLTKAQLDVNTIAAGITKFYKDTGRWPFEKDGTSSAAYASGTDAAVLTSNPACRGTAIGGGTPCDANAPTDASTGSSWALTTAIGDSLHDQLVLNDPFGAAAGSNAYTMSGKRAWNGPYLFNIATLDPWGHSYFVNIASAAPVLEGAETQEWVIVISAGPDGALNTATGEVWTSPAVGETMPEGDDIVAVVK
jgi:prepilin-type N-terminal cleavage/methylation domain-containing protein